jgi:rhamnose utilization protein RhaD (predicted bifunctional aldolase and dehydrogenase)
VKTKQARDQKQEASEVTKRAEQADDIAQRLKERIDKWKKTAHAAQKQASRALSSRSKRASVSADGTTRPAHRVQAASGANGGKRMALDEVITLTQGSFISREMGGIRYRKNECVLAMQSDVDE